MTRTPDEWVGKTDDEPVPARVRLRVFERFNGICHRSGRKIRPGDPWQADHIIAIINGGQNRESNLAPILAGKNSPNSEKTAEDVKTKAKIARVAKLDKGLKQSSRPLPCGKKSKFKRTIDGRIVPRT